MRGDAERLVRFGPWAGGLNIRDAKVAADLVPTTQLRRLVNLDVTDSGVLVPRRGCRRAGSTTMYTELGGSGVFQLLGSVDDVATGNRLAVVGVFDGATPGATFFHYASQPHSRAVLDWPATATTASEPSRFTSVVQYNNLIYFVPSPAGTGQGWSRTSLSAGGFTSVPNMPKGHAAFMVRERMFVVDQTANRVYWSKATDAATWAAPDGGSVDVNPGDGQVITAAVVVNSQIYLFKKTRTYLFTFTSDPATDGQLTLINDQLGALSALPYENGVLLVNSRGVYRLLNNFFAQVDQLVNLGEVFDLPSAAAGALWITVEGDQLVIGPAAATDTYGYVAMNLRTSAWSGRIYPDPTVAPGSRSIRGRSLGEGEAILYGDGQRVLGASRLSPASSRPTYTLDYTAASEVISPEYSLITGEWDAADPTMHKQIRLVSARLSSSRPAGDAVLQLRTYATRSGTMDIDTTAQTASLVAGQWGGKVPGIEAYRFLSTALELRKAQTTLSPTVTDPLTPSDLWVRGLFATASPSEGSARA